MLESIDDALRNGRNMTRANLAFEYLCDRYGQDRRQLRTYLRDMEEIEEQDKEYIDMYKRGVVPK